MNDAPERHRPSESVVESIFAEALERSSEEREAFLDARCKTDTGLRARVATLLAALPEAEAVFEAATLHEQMRDAARTADGRVDRTGTTLGHYRLDEFLGAGGMGEVYRASDVALGRSAAVKILRGAVDEGLRKRLLREARTNARLEHPGIATFFEAGTVDDIDFLAMEFVDGESLRSRLKQGPLPPEDALTVVDTLLEALVHSHAAGIVHRDIKPDNIMLTSTGAAKLLDFGIAKRIEDAEPIVPEATTRALPTQLTSHGMIVGTVGYMSPEQLRGEPVNERTDVFAVGAVLYEVLTGEPAFPGRTSAQRMAAVLSREIPAVTADGMGPDIDVILRTAMARDANDRFGSAKDFLRALRDFSTGETIALLPNTIAILDLQNLSRDPEDDWIGSGMAESLGLDLARVESIELVPRPRVKKTAAALAAGGTLDPAALGLALGCRWVLTGSYQRMGPALRLGMQLVEVSTGKDVWIEKIDGRIDDIFSIQDRLAGLTARSLDTVLPERDRRSQPKVDTFEMFARANRLMDTFERAKMEEAYGLYQRILEAEPDHASALARLASVHAPARWSQTGDLADLQAAEEYANRALESDPELSNGYVYRGYARWRRDQIDAALDDFAKAAALDARNYMAPYFAGCCRAQRGEWSRAVELQQRANELQSGAPFVLGGLGWCHLQVGDVESARWTLTRAYESETKLVSLGWAGSGAFLAEFHRRVGELDRARSVVLEALDLVEQRDHMTRIMGRIQCLSVLGRVALEQGDLDAARAAFEQDISLVENRTKAVGAGHVLITCLCGLTRAGAGPETYERAVELYRDPGEFSMSWGLIAADQGTLIELARAAATLGRDDERRQLEERARALGATERIQTTEP